MRHTVPEAEALLDVKHPVLDNGFVILVDYMGSDQRVADAARLSYAKETRDIKEDPGLIDYLMRNRHTSPFEQVELTFHMGLPITAARQMVRHRTASLNEMSGRYSELPELVYLPSLERIKRQSKINKQGSGEDFPVSVKEGIQAKMKACHDYCFNVYHELLELGLAKETARGVVPVDTYTQWYWKMDLHNLMHFLGLRMDSHAQYEVRQFANVMATMARAVAPLTMAAFENHRLNSITLTQEDCEELRNYIHSQPCRYTSPSKRAEFEAKMAKGGFDTWRV